MKKKIAVPIDDSGILDGHFGHCKFLAVATEENGEILSEEIIVPPPHEPGLLPEWLSERSITDIIAGGMGQKAIQLFNIKGINVFVGAPQLSWSKLIEGHLNNSLQLNANYCNHESGHEHECKQKS